MPIFAYKGFDGSGRAVSGTQDAENARAIKQALRRDGIFVTELRETAMAQKEKGKRSLSFGFMRERVSTNVLAVATRQLATLVGSGIPLVESLAALVDQTEGETFKAVWADVRQKVNEGTSLGDALGGHPRVFSGLYVNMVRAGETSGALEVVLNRLADFTESQAELRSKLIGTMVYPVLMICMATFVTGILFIFVIPKISMIFEAQKVALPLPTLILIGISSFVRDYWWLALPLLIGAVVGFQRYIRSERGRPWWHRVTLNMPIFGPLTRMIAIARFTRTLGTLLASGVQLLVSFDIVKNVVQNTVLIKVIEDARDAVREGESIAAPLKRSGQFPPIVTHMIAIGERSGQLESMLNNIARSYDIQVDARLRAMTSILEPVMIVFLGVVVGFIIFSIILPMLQISSFA
jgi:general secretion pathway protein F